MKNVLTEWKKVCGTRAGLLIIFVFLFSTFLQLILFVKPSIPAMEMHKENYLKLMELFGGEQDAFKWEKFRAYGDTFGTLRIALQDNRRQLSEGKRTIEDFHREGTILEEKLAEEPAYNILSEQMVRSYENDFRTEVLYENGWHMLFDRSVLFLPLLFVILYFSAAIIIRDREVKMEEILLTTAEGHRNNARIKLVAILLNTSIFSLIAFGQVLLVSHIRFGLTQPHAPVQSLERFSGFLPCFSLLELTALHFAGILLSMICVALTTLLIAYLSQSYLLAFVLPFILYLFETGSLSHGKPLLFFSPWQLGSMCYFQVSTEEAGSFQNRGILSIMAAVLFLSIVVVFFLRRWRNHIVLKHGFVTFPAKKVTIFVLLLLILTFCSCRSHEESEKTGTLGGQLAIRYGSGLVTVDSGKQLNLYRVRGGEIQVEPLIRDPLFPEGKVFFWSLLAQDGNQLFYAITPEAPEPQSLQDKMLARSSLEIRVLNLETREDRRAFYFPDYSRSGVPDFFVDGHSYYSLEEGCLYRQDQMGRKELLLEGLFSIQFIDGYGLGQSLRGNLLLYHLRSGEVTDLTEEITDSTVCYQDGRLYYNDFLQENRLVVYDIQSGEKNFLGEYYNLILRDIDANHLLVTRQGEGLEHDLCVLSLQDGSQRFLTRIDPLDVVFLIGEKGSLIFSKEKEPQYVEIPMEVKHASENK